MYSEGFSAEVWFKLRMENLRMLDRQPPSMSQIKSVLEQYFKVRVERALFHMSNIEDSEEWLDLIFKTDSLLRLQNIVGQSLRIAVDVTTRRSEVQGKMDMISSRLFKLARKDLAIDRHWVVLVDSQALPSKDRLMDIFYEEVDKNFECAVIEF
jgi:hypothetical protein